MAVPKEALQVGSDGVTMLWDKIQKKLDEQEKTVYWLSKQTGIHINTIYSLKNNLAKDMAFSKVSKIANALNVDLNEFKETEK